MQLSMCDEVKKNTTSNILRDFAPLCVIAVMSRGMAYSRYLDDPFAILRDSLFMIPHDYTYVKRFYKLF